MAAHFHSLKIKSIVKETPDTVSILFDVPADLTESFAFREGQSLTLRTTINGEEVRRSYSLCSAPHEGEWKVAVKKTTGGLFSSFANEKLKAGDVIDVMPPAGNFCSTGKAGNFLAVAAGSGITPVISVIKHVLKAFPKSAFTLIYGNQSRGSVIFFEEIENLKNSYMERFNVIHVLSRERTDAAINYGRINAEKLKDLSSMIEFADFDDAWVCGPEELIFSTRDFLRNQGMPERHIHFELFTSPGQKKVAKTVNAPDNNAPKSKVTVKLDGRSFDLDLAYESDSILDAALAKGADLPYACKGGVCCTCRAKLIEGKVRMDVNYALEKEEVKAGFILTCQSHPLTERVVVDFDSRN